MIRKNIKPAVIRQQANIRHWKGLLHGEPAFLIGNGPSVADEDVKQVANHFTIGINRAFYLFDPVVLFWQDISLWDTEKTHLTKTTSIKVCRDISDPLHRFNNFRLRSTDGFRLADSPHVLFGSGATGPLAYQFAYTLGCDPIICVGFDCQYRDGKTDFYGVNPHHRSHTLTMCSRGLHWIKSASEERRLINCSANDVLGPRMKLADILPTLPPPKGRDTYINLFKNHGF